MKCYNFRLFYLINIPKSPFYFIITLRKVIQSFCPRGCPHGQKLYTGSAREAGASQEC